MTDLALRGGRGEPPARLRRRDLRRGAHARGRRRRAPRAEAHQRPGRVHADQALQRPDRARACSSITGSTRPCDQVQRARLRGTRLLRRRRRLAGAARGAQRPAPQADRLARHARRGAAQARDGDRSGGRGDRRARSSGRAARRPGPLRRPGGVARLVARPGGRRQRLLDRGRADGRGGGSRWPCAPLDVGPTLRRELFDRVPTCVLTSATLSVGSPPRFDFFKARLGLTACETLATRQPVRLPAPGRRSTCPGTCPTPRSRLGRVRAAGDPGDPALPGEDAGQGVRPVHVVPDDGGRRPRADPLVRPAQHRAVRPERRHAPLEDGRGVQGRRQQRDLRRRQLLAGGGRARRGALERDHRPPAVQRPEPPAAGGPPGGRSGAAAATRSSSTRCPRPSSSSSRGSAA